MNKNKKIINKNNQVFPKKTYIYETKNLGYAMQRITIQLNERKIKTLKINQLGSKRSTLNSN